MYNAGAKKKVKQNIERDTRTVRERGSREFHHHNDLNPFSVRTTRFDLAGWMSGSSGRTERESLLSIKSQPGGVARDG